MIGWRDRRRYLLGIASLAVVVILSACSGGGGGGGGTGTAIPTLVSTVPVADAENVPVDSNIVLQFSVAMDRVLTEAAIAITPAVMLSCSWNPASTVVTCVPGALAAGTGYAVSVSTQARSAAGVNLATARQFSFTTTAGGGGTPPDPDDGGGTPPPDPDDGGGTPPPDPDDGGGTPPPPDSGEPAPPGTASCVLGGPSVLGACKLGL